MSTASWLWHILYDDSHYKVSVVSG